MTSMTQWACVVLASLALVIPLRADAGGAVTAHQVTMTIKGSAQGTNGSGDDINDRSNGNVKDVFELCTGAPATKTQGVYLFMNCSVPNDNEIDAIETNPLGGISSVGSLEFDLLNGITTTKNGVLKTVTVPVTVHISCNAGALVAELTGIMDIKFSDLAGNDCPLSASVKVTGVGTSNSGMIPDAFIVDDGSSIKAKNRSGAIASFPVF